MKRSLLAFSITVISLQAAQAAPFMPMDARGLAMGNTGVASAKLAHAPAYNPSLLAQARAKDDFALLLPQVGAVVGDQEELIDQAELITDKLFPNFEASLDNGNGQGLDLSINALNASVNDLLDALDGFDGTDTSTSVNNIKAANDTLQGKLNAVNSDLTQTNSSIHELTKSLQAISGNPLNARLGLAGGVAVPSKKFAVAVSIQGNADLSARINFSQNDIDLLNEYGQATQGLIDRTKGISDQINSLNPDNTNIETVIEDISNDTALLQSYEYTSKNGVQIYQDGRLTNQASDPDLATTAQIVGVSVIDLGVSFAREFDIRGQKVAIGVTPKLQKISTFHYASEIDAFEELETDDLKDSQRDYNAFNLDIGASYRFGADDQYMVGLVAKNLLGGSYKYADLSVPIAKMDENDNLIVNGSTTMRGGKVSLSPQLRAGVGYSSKWVNLAADLDLTENKPVAFEAASRYVSVGAELNVYDTFQLRAGLRSNLAQSGNNVASVGLGLSPFGVHIDIAAMANLDDPKKEAGAVLETGFYF